MPLRTANIIGSGPNGLAAAITLAQRGVSVNVYERNQTLGGACSTAEITLPGFQHDLGASAFPLGVCSPFLASLPLEQHGLRWIEPLAPLAHPFVDGSALLLEYSVDATVARMPAREMASWRHFVDPFIRHWPEIIEDILHPLLGLPQHPLAMIRFSLPAALPAARLSRARFRHPHMRALFAGCAAHSVVPLSMLGSSATGILLSSAAHTTGWPIVAGGAGNLTQAMASYLRSLGGRIETGCEIKALQDLPSSDATFFDTSTEALARISGPALSQRYLSSLERFRRGPGIFKLDWALSGPIPWKNPECLRAATVHLGESLEEIARSEHAAFYGGETDKPFVLLVQPSLFDPSRAPEGKHTAWAYCHVPAGSKIDRTELIERQVERFAPGFRDLILARKASSAAELSSWNPNLACGDISGGAMTVRQMVLRPTRRLYRTSNRSLYLCSASTPPGGGVHGMCGHNAALEALEDHGF
ncbi:MAG: NAD(P)/FAD-dependent oxidoreductase [Acidobacteriaceae bacterium]|nr:NAD(P)/FAD-dependent oxidoreductase [Acidobacteriaceae bacterium]